MALHTAGLRARTSTRKIPLRNPHSREPQRPFKDLAQSPLPRNRVLTLPNASVTQGRDHFTGAGSPAKIRPPHPASTLPSDYGQHPWSSSGLLFLSIQAKGSQCVISGFETGSCITVFSFTLSPLLLVLFSSWECTPCGPLEMSQGPHQAWVQSSCFS